MKTKCIFLVYPILIFNCVVANSTNLVSLRHSIKDEVPRSQFVADTKNKDSICYEEFVQIFFSDSIFQRKHVYFPLVLSYWEEQAGDDYSIIEKTAIIHKNEYQIIKLDARCEVKIIVNEDRELCVIASIPDTALEAEFYFINNDTYLLNKIKITGDASPF